MRRALAVAVAVVLLVAAVALIRKALRSDEEILSDAIDEARSALVQHRDEDFLAFFAPEVRYRGDGDREDLERDLRRWIELRVGRADVLSREIDVVGDRAAMRLDVEVGMSVQFRRQVAVVLEAARTEDGWRVDALDWK